MDFRCYAWVRGLLLVLGAVVALGCATPLGQFGDHARYSPAYRAYVLSEHTGSDDPDDGATVVLLRDPLTGSKLMCHEDVADWRELFEDVAVDQVQDSNADTAGVVTGSVLMAHFMVVQPLGVAGTLESMLAGGAVYDALRSDNAAELLAQGIAWHERTRHATAVLFIERALAKDATLGLWSKAYYYLGLAYAEGGQDERARLALSLFVRRAGVRDVKAFRDAEARLDELGDPLEECESQEPLKVYW